MTCANCVTTIERNLKKLDGVQSAVVNLSSERGTVDFDPAKLGLGDIIAPRLSRGYGVATGEADLVIKRLSDSNDAVRLEKALAKLEGVLEAQVTVASEKARVKYVPPSLRRRNSARGCLCWIEALEPGGNAEDVEAKAREDEINEQWRMLIIGLIFTVPLFLLSMARTLVCCPSSFMQRAVWKECATPNPGSDG